MFGITQMNHLDALALHRRLQTSIVSLTYYQKRLHLTEASVRSLRVEKTVSCPDVADCVEWTHCGSSLLCAGRGREMLLLGMRDKDGRSTPDCPVRARFSSKHVEPVQDLKVLHSGADLKYASAGRDGKTCLFTVAPSGGYAVKTYYCSSQNVRRLAAPPTRSHLVYTMSSDGCIRLIDDRVPHTCLYGGCRNEVLLSTSHRLKSMELNGARQEELVVGSSSHYISVFDLRYLRRTGDVKDALYYLSPFISEPCGSFADLGRGKYSTKCLWFSRDGAELLACHGDDVVAIYNLLSGERSVRSFEFNSDHRTCQSDHEINPSSGNFSWRQHHFYRSNGETHAQHKVVAAWHIYTRYLSNTGLMISNEALCSHCSTAIDLLNDELLTGRFLSELYLLRARLLSRDKTFENWDNAKSDVQQCLFHLNEHNHQLIPIEPHLAAHCGSHLRQKTAIYLEALFLLAKIQHRLHREGEFRKCLVELGHFHHLFHQDHRQLRKYQAFLMAASLEAPRAEELVASHLPTFCAPPRACSVVACDTPPPACLRPGSVNFRVIRCTVANNVSDTLKNACLLGSNEEWIVAGGSSGGLFLWRKYDRMQFAKMDDGTNSKIKALKVRPSPAHLPGCMYELATAHGDRVSLWSTS